MLKTMTTVQVIRYEGMQPLFLLKLAIILYREDAEAKQGGYLTGRSLSACLIWESLLGCSCMVCLSFILSDPSALALAQVLVCWLRLPRHWSHLALTASLFQYFSSFTGKWFRVNSKGISIVWPEVRGLPPVLTLPHNKQNLVYTLSLTRKPPGSLSDFPVRTPLVPSTWIFMFLQTWREDCSPRCSR